MRVSQRLLAQFRKRVSARERAPGIVKIEPAAAARGIIQRLAERGEVRWPARQRVESRSCAGRGKLGFR